MSPVSFLDTVCSICGAAWTANGPGKAWDSLAFLLCMCALKPGCDWCCFLSSWLRVSTSGVFSFGAFQSSSTHASIILKTQVCGTFRDGGTYDKILRRFQDGKIQTV